MTVNITDSTRKSTRENLFNSKAPVLVLFNNSCVRVSLVRRINDTDKATALPVSQFPLSEKITRLRENQPDNRNQSNLISTNSNNNCGTRTNKMNSISSKHGFDNYTFDNCTFNLIS